ncbi:MAG: hypothetical protein ACFFFB_09985 [Candidatus Heimdallarchaeota archaeon]
MKLEGNESRKKDKNSKIPIIGIGLFPGSIGLFFFVGSFIDLFYLILMLIGIGLVMKYLLERYRAHPIYKTFALTDLEHIQARLSRSGFKKAGILKEIRVHNEIAGYILKEGNMQYHLRLIKLSDTEFGVSIHYEYANSSPAHLLGYNDKEKAISKIIEVFS